MICYHLPLLNLFAGIPDLFSGWSNYLHGEVIHVFNTVLWHWYHLVSCKTIEGGSSVQAPIYTHLTFIDHEQEISTSWRSSSLLGGTYMWNFSVSEKYFCSKSQHQFPFWNGNNYLQLYSVPSHSDFKAIQCYEFTEALQVLVHLLNNGERMCLKFT